MNLVIYIDGSRAAEDAVRYAARWCPPETRVVLLHVVPSGREAALHNAEKVLARSSALFRSLAGTQREVTTRLEVGNAVTRIAKGFHARVVQHECDHLDGVLYPQRMGDLTRLIFESEVRHHLQPQD